MHHNDLISQLGRDPGILVSCLDYFTNIEHILLEATIIEEDISKYIVTSNLIDKLTKLFIKGVFDVIMLKESDYSRRFNTPLSLLMIDIDDFKLVNDHHGHQKGDDVLSKVGAIILDSTRSMDIACRYGGEEFAIIMPNTESESAKYTADRIRSNIEAYDFDNVSVTVSIGVCTSVNDDTTLNDFIYSADEVLYKAKKTGKNKVVM